MYGRTLISCTVSPSFTCSTTTAGRHIAVVLSPCKKTTQTAGKRQETGRGERRAFRLSVQVQVRRDSNPIPPPVSC